MTYKEKFEAWKEMMGDNVYHDDILDLTNFCYNLVSSNVMSFINYNEEPKDVPIRDRLMSFFTDLSPYSFLKWDYKKQEERMLNDIYAFKGRYSSILPNDFEDKVNKCIEIRNHKKELAEKYKKCLA